MVRVPTVLIVGAGGSKPFGFPLGFELRQFIARSAPKLSRSGFNADFASRFGEALLSSGLCSIDAFLANREDFRRVGKVAIAAQIARCEDPHRIFDPNATTPSWYERLFASLRADRERFNQNRLTVITFNYDRSLDWFLRMAIASSFGCEPEEENDLCAAVPILHVHGSLGSLEQRPYRPTTEDPSLLQAADRIRVVFEDPRSDPILADARLAIAKAEVVYIVGFGYDPANIELLDLARSLPEKSSVFASAYGLTASEIALAEKYLGFRPEWGFPESDAAAFLRNAPPMGF